MTCLLTAQSRDVALDAASRFFCAPGPTLAQTDPQHSIDIAFWIGVLTIMLVVGFGIAIWLKKRYETSADAPIQTTFTLDDLRRMHREGQLTDEEFERARERILAQSGYVKPADPDVVETRDTDPASDAEETAGDAPQTTSAPPASTDLSSPQTPPAPALDADAPDDDLGPELLPDTERDNGGDDSPDRDKPDPGGDESRDRFD